MASGEGVILLWETEDKYAAAGDEGGAATYSAKADESVEQTRVVHESVPASDPFRATSSARQPRMR